MSSLNVVFFSLFVNQERGLNISILLPHIHNDVVHSFIRSLQLLKSRKIEIHLHRAQFSFASSIFIEPHLGISVSSLPFIKQMFDI